MLVLKRKKYEQIHIGNDIVITIVESNSHVVKVGIEAPRELAIWRSGGRERRAESGERSGDD